MNNRIAAALEKADWECAHGGVPGHQTHRTLVREALEEAALTVLEDKPFSGLGLAAAIRALLGVKP